VRSLVGLIPIFAVERLEDDWIEPFREFTTNLKWFVNNRQEIVSHCVNTVARGKSKTLVLTIVSPEQLNRILQRVWDTNEFRSSYGLRSLSKFHEVHPYSLGDSVVRYEPAESECKIKGGNSNWRGPIWFPTTFLMIESLRKLDKAYGDTLNIRDLQGKRVVVGEMAKYFADSLISIFTRGADGRRAVFGDVPTFQNDPYWCDYIPFGEYFDGETGKGLGATHQTGWTGLVASLIDEWRQ
jgi:hypothetical protein